MCIEELWWCCRRGTSWSMLKPPLPRCSDGRTNFYFRYSCSKALVVPLDLILVSCNVIGSNVRAPLLRQPVLHLAIIFNHRQHRSPTSSWQFIPELRSTTVFDVVGSCRAFRFIPQVSPTHSDTTNNASVSMAVAYIVRDKRGSDNQTCPSGGDENSCHRRTTGQDFHGRGSRSNPCLGLDRVP